VELEDGSDVLFGRVIGLRDVITFQGVSVSEVTQAFHDSVDDYLEFCAKRGESPEKPYSGQFVLRLRPQLHRELANLAQTKSTSLNALIEGMLEKRVFHDAEERSSGPAKITQPAPISKTKLEAAERKRRAKQRGKEKRIIDKQAQAVIDRLKEIRATESQKKSTL
jgi:predicted HicB family RNase H-like nuclease